LQELGLQYLAVACRPFSLERPFMKALLLVGVVVLVLGIVSFFVPFPHSEHHGVSLGDAHIGVTTHDDEKISPAVSVILVVAGAGLMLAGRKA
jgi:hypothetical protein